MSLRIEILFQFLLFATIVNGQTSLDPPTLDTNSKKVALLFKQKKNNDALTLVNKLIVDNPSDGISYFNRAVLNYFRIKSFPNLKIETLPEFCKLANAIITDLTEAKKFKYNNPELHYLFFLMNFTPNLSNNCGLNQEKSKDSIVVDNTKHVVWKDTLDYEVMKKQIDNALKLMPWDEKYLWARLEFFTKYEITSAYYEVYGEDIPTLRSDCKKIIEITKNKKRKYFAYYYLAEAYKTYFTDTLSAIQFYSAAIDVDPSYNITYSERGKLRAGINHCEEAISDFTFYLARKKDADIFIERALCFESLNKSTSALKDLNAAIVIYEQNRKNILSSNYLVIESLGFHQIQWGTAYLLRGLINNDLGNKKAALSDLNKAIEYGSKSAIEVKNELFQSSISIQNDEMSSQMDINSSVSSIPMIKKGGVYEIPITINNVLKINFIFDAGASDVSISADVALTLIRTGTVSDKDYIGTTTYRFADGSTAKSKVFLLKELQIGTKKITNVKASISNSLDAPLLLGQSVLNRFGKVTIDYKKNVIVFEE